jgi:hypothetical protein
MTFRNVLKNFRAKRFRSLKVFADLPRSVDITDEHQIFFYCTEYYGKLKRKQIAVYNKAKERLIIKALTRVEVRFNDKDIVPIKYFSEFRSLNNKPIFNNCWLRTTRGNENLSDNEILLLKRFEAIREDLNTSLMVTQQVAKKEFEKNEYLALLIALNKSAKKHYDFEKAFRFNFNNYLKQPMSSVELRFLAALRKRMCSEAAHHFYVETTKPKWKTIRPLKSFSSRHIQPFAILPVISVAGFT